MASSKVCGVTNVSNNDRPRMYHANNVSDLRSAFSLRYKAYRKVEGIPENREQLFYDEYDSSFRSTIFIVRVNDTPIASIRSVISDTSAGEETTAQSTFSDAFVKLGISGRLIEANRFVVDPTLRNEANSLVHKLAFKATVLSALIANVDWYVAAVRNSHAPFYRRQFDMHVVSEEKVYPGTNIRMVLTVADFRSAYKKFKARYPDMAVSDADVKMWHADGVVNLVSP